MKTIIVLFTILLQTFLQISDGTVVSNCIPTNNFRLEQNNNISTVILISTLYLNVTSPPNFQSNIHLIEDLKQEVQTHKTHEVWLWIAAISSSVIFSFILYATGKRQAARNKTHQKQLDTLLASYKLRNITTQLSPHFLHNAIESIWQLSSSKAKSDIRTFTDSLSYLLRKTLEFQQHTTIPLSKELAFVEQYLDLKQIVYPDKFSYQIDVAPEVNLHQDIIPMSIQSHVENAVKHGIRPLRQKGEIKVMIQNDQSYLSIIIEDNGIGYTNNAPTSSTQIGLYTQRELINFFNARNRQKITLDISNNAPNGQPQQGTQVTIQIPINYQYLLS